MGAIIKGLSKNLITIILTKEDLGIHQDDFISSLKNGEIYGLGLMGVKNPENQIHTKLKVCDLGEI